MEDDDEFGDLYTDVLQKFPVSQSHDNFAAPSPIHRPIDLNLKSDSHVPPSAASYPNSTSAHSSAGHPQLVNLHVPPRAFPSTTGGVSKGKDGELTENDVKFDIEEGNNGILNDEMAVIPGISVKEERNDVVKGVEGNDDVVAGEQEEEDWDSDSEDDLQIVLNDNRGPIMIDDGGGDDDDDDDEDGDPLVIVADVDANNQGLLEEQDWGGGAAGGGGGDETGVAAAGIAEGGVEKKEAGERMNGVAGAATAAVKIGYSNHYGYHNPYHSQFKVSLLVS